MANYEIQTIARAKHYERNVRAKLENIAQQQELYIEQRLFCNKVIAMMKTVRLFCKQRLKRTLFGTNASSILITDENKTKCQ